MKLNYTLQDAWSRHHDCQVVIYHKKFANGDVIPGLYCGQYGIWIQWLDMQTADELMLEGIEVVLEQPKKRRGHPVKWIAPAELGI
jgi:hypothetical protein